MRERDQFDHQDLGLGYPPADQTPDLRPNKEVPSVHSAKNDTEGDTTTTEQEQ